MATLNVIVDYDYVGEMHYVYLDDKIITWGDYDSGGLSMLDEVAAALGVEVKTFKPIDEASSDKFGEPDFDFMKFSNVEHLLELVDYG